MQLLLLKELGEQDLKLLESTLLVLVGELNYFGAGAGETHPDKTNVSEA
jgi:hypothetical protein